MASKFFAVAGIHPKGGIGPFIEASIHEDASVRIFTTRTNDIRLTRAQARKFFTKGLELLDATQPLYWERNHMNEIDQAIAEIETVVMLMAGEDSLDHDEIFSYTNRLLAAQDHLRALQRCNLFTEISDAILRDRSQPSGLRKAVEEQIKWLEERTVIRPGSSGLNQRVPDSSCQVQADKLRTALQGQ